MSDNPSPQTVTVPTHTPGPWSVGQKPFSHGHHYETEIYEQNGNSDGGKMPAIVLGRTKEETLARARLIAAAPDLVEALQRVVADIETGVKLNGDVAMIGPKADCVIQARAALARAGSAS